MMGRVSNTSSSAFFDVVFCDPLAWLAPLKKLLISEGIAAIFWDMGANDRSKIRARYGSCRK
jgi:hypothetical protein